MAPSAAEAQPKVQQSSDVKFTEPLGAISKPRFIVLNLGFTQGNITLRTASLDVDWMDPLPAEVGQDEVTLNMCCRQDAEQVIPIRLPTPNSFALIKVRCTLYQLLLPHHVASFQRKNAPVPHKFKVSTQTNITVLVIKRNTVYVSSAIIGRAGLFGYVIYFLTYAHCLLQNG